MRGARARASAERMRKLVLSYYRCFDDWDKIKKVEESKPPFGHAKPPSKLSQSSSKFHTEIATPGTAARDYIIDSGASVNLITQIVEQG